MPLADRRGRGPLRRPQPLRLLDRDRAPRRDSSGEQNRHRLSRAGNRRMNHMIHIAAISQIRVDTPGRVYYRRKRAEGKKPLEAIRCLKRRITEAIYRQLVADAQAAAETAEPQGGGQARAGPGGHRGASHQSSAVGSHPPTDTSDQPLPGPAKTTLQPVPRPRNISRPEGPLNSPLDIRGGAEVTRRYRGESDQVVLAGCPCRGVQRGRRQAMTAAQRCMASPHMVAARLRRRRGVAVCGQMDVGET